jgi:DNA-binding response OmpR family regulator
MLIDLMMPDDVTLAAVQALAQRGHQFNGIPGMPEAELPGDVCLIGFGGDTASIIQNLSYLQRSTHRSGPVVVLMPVNDVGTKIELFRAGVDDCLVIPIDAAELEARLEALVIRLARHRTNHLLKVADLSMDLQTFVATRAGRPIHLYPASRKLLTALMAASPAVVDYKTLEHAIWDDHANRSGNLRSHAYELRQSVDAAFDIKLIHVVRGVGYCLKAALDFSPSGRRRA